MVFNEEIIKFILSKDETDSYIHRSESKEKAEKILEEGLYFENSLTNTASYVQNEAVFNFVLNSHRSYGDYIIVLNFSKSFGLDLLITKGVKFSKETDEFSYLTNPKYIKGYIDTRENKIYSNKDHDPKYYDLINLENVIQENLEILEIKLREGSFSEEEKVYERSFLKEIAKKIHS